MSNIAGSMLWHVVEAAVINAGRLSRKPSQELLKVAQKCQGSSREFHSGAVNATEGILTIRAESPTFVHEVDPLRSLENAVSKYVKPVALEIPRVQQLISESAGKITHAVKNTLYSAAKVIDSAVQAKVIDSVAHSIVPEQAKLVQSAPIIESMRTVLHIATSKHLQGIIVSAMVDYDVRVISKVILPARELPGISQQFTIPLTQGLVESAPSLFEAAAASVGIVGGGSYMLYSQCATEGPQGEFDPEGNNNDDLTQIALGGLVAGGGGYYASKISAAASHQSRIFSVRDVSPDQKDSAKAEPHQSRIFEKKPSEHGVIAASVLEDWHTPKYEDGELSEFDKAFDFSDADFLVQ